MILADAVKISKMGQSSVVEQNHCPLCIERPKESLRTVLAQRPSFLQLGAFVNEQFQAREGFDAATFCGSPTYLGHYHKPQILPGTEVRYVGSPYQGDSKLFLEL